MTFIINGREMIRGPEQASKHHEKKSGTPKLALFTQGFIIYYGSMVVLVTLLLVQSIFW